MDIFHIRTGNHISISIKISNADKVKHIPQGWCAGIFNVTWLIIAKTEKNYMSTECTGYMNCGTSKQWNYCTAVGKKKNEVDLID